MAPELTDTRHESYLRPFFKEMMKSKHQWCVLHSVDNLPYHSCSDVDIVIAGKFTHDIERIINKVADIAKWHVVQVFWYDIQYGKYYVLKHDASNTFLAVDILYDIKGLGRYGFKTSLLVEKPKFNGLFNQTNIEVEFCYKLVKRIEKKYFTDSDRKLFINYYKKGDKEKLLSLLCEQYGKKLAKTLLQKFAYGKFPELTNKDFIKYKYSHFIQRKLLSLQLLSALFWQAIRIKDRLLYPCGIIVSIPSNKQEDAQLVIKHVRNKMGLSFRSYITANSKDTLKIISALITSKLCVITSKQTDTMDHYIISHWKNSQTNLNDHITYLAKAMFTRGNDEKYGHKYIDALTIEIDKVLTKRIQERSLTHF